VGYASPRAREIVLTMLNVRSYRDGHVGGLAARLALRAPDCVAAAVVDECRVGRSVGVDRDDRKWATGLFNTVVMGC